MITFTVCVLRLRRQIKNSQIICSGCNRGAHRSAEKHTKLLREKKIDGGIGGIKAGCLFSSPVRLSMGHFTTKRPPDMGPRDDRITKQLDLDSVDRQLDLKTKQGSNFLNPAWDKGYGGYEWKRRFLNERRDAAMLYQFNPSARQPLHNAARQRASMNEKRFKRPSCSINNDIHSAAARSDSAAHIMMQAMFSSSAMERSEEIAASEAVQEYAKNMKDESMLDHEACTEGIDENMLLENGTVDTLAYLPYGDVKSLAEELYGAVSDECIQHEESLWRNWYRLRKGGGNAKSCSSVLGTSGLPFQHFNSVPSEQRYSWMPWYLNQMK